MQSKIYKILALSCALAFSHATVIHGAQKATKFPLCYRSKAHDISILVIRGRPSCCSTSFRPPEEHEFGKAAGWREKQVAISIAGYRVHTIRTLYRGKTDFKKNAVKILTEREIEAIEQGEVELAVEDDQTSKAASILVKPKATSPRSTTTTDQPSQE